MILAHEGRLVKLTGDATERRVQLGAYPVHGGDDDDGDAGGDQGILNGGGARLLLHKTRNDGLHFVRSLHNTHVVMRAIQGWFASYRTLSIGILNSVKLIHKNWRSLR